MQNTDSKFPLEFLASYTKRSPSFEKQFELKIHKET